MKGRSVEEAIFKEDGGYRISLYSVSFLLFCIFLLLKPFYLLPSGLPQAADFALMLAFIMMLFSEGAKLIVGKDKLFAAFVACVIVINGTYYCILGESYFLTASVYYVFNFLGVIVFRYFSSNNSYLKTIRTILRVVLVLQLVLLLADLGRMYGSTRYMGTFNDPNQFGVFVLFSFLMIKIIDRLLGGQRIIWIDDLMAIALLVPCASTGALVGFAVYYSALLAEWMIALTKKGKGAYAFLLLVVLATAVASVFLCWDVVASLLSQTNFGSRIVQKAALVFGGNGDGYDFFSDRMLERIFYYPEFFLFGSGEGGFDRFASIQSPLEMHCTVIALFFYYGIGPCLLLLAWVVSNLKGMRKRGTWVAALALLAECITLANQRQPLFWMLIVMFGDSGESSQERHRHVFNVKPSLCNVRSGINAQLRLGNKGHDSSER